MAIKDPEYFEIFEKHDKDDVCSMCHGFFTNYVYNYEEMYKRYNGHLRHLFLFQYHRRGKKDMTEYNIFKKHCQNIGFFWFKCAKRIMDN